MTEAQRQFIEAFGRLPSIPHACREAGIKPAEYREWLKSDRRFADLVESIGESVLWQAAFQCGGPLTEVSHACLSQSVARMPNPCPSPESN